MRSVLWGFAFGFKGILILFEVAKDALPHLAESGLPREPPVDGKSGLWSSQFLDHRVQPLVKQRQIEYRRKIPRIIWIDMTPGGE